MVVRSGGHVTVVALSDGESGFPADDSRSIGVRRALRRTELRAAMAEIGVADVLSARRTRSITRPRQIAMALAKELTSHSLPEIGEAFGGRDHTTVLHACRKINELKESDGRIGEDYSNLWRLLST